MQVFTCPARYRRHVESSLALALAEVRRDMSCRADEDARVRALAPVPDALLDLDEPGHLFAVVTLPNEGLIDANGFYTHTMPR